MSRSSGCTRPGCTGAPVALLTYDYARRTAWVRDLDTDLDVVPAWPMCEAHTQRLTVPVGWALQDERPPRLLRPPLAG